MTSQYLPEFWKSVVFGTKNTVLFMSNVFKDLIGFCIPLLFDVQV